MQVKENRDRHWEERQRKLREEQEKKEALYLARQQMKKVRLMSTSSLAYSAV